MLLLHRVTVLLALTFLYAGDIILLENAPFYSFTTGLILFLIALLLYSFYFYKQTIYDIDQLIAFLAVSLLIALALIYLMYDGLNNLLIPVMIYFATVLNFMKIAFLRYKNVNTKSYRLVLIGAIFLQLRKLLLLGWIRFTKQYHTEAFLLCFFMVLHNYVSLWEFCH